MLKKKVLAGALAPGLLITTATPAFAGRYYTENYYGTPTQFAEIYMDNGVESNTIFQPITIHVDGSYLNTDTNATIINGRTLVPMRAAGEAVGAEVNWDQATSTATATKDGKTATFTLNSTTYSINGEEKTTDTAPILVMNRTMLPLRVFAEAFNAEVTWDQAKYDVSIDTAAADAPAPNIPAGASATAQKLIQKYYVQADSTDPYKGSWRRTYSFPAYDNGYNYEAYRFVSKIDSGYSIVNLTVSVAHNGNPDEIVMSRDYATLGSDGRLVVEYRNDIFYSVGPYLGPISNILYDTYHYYSVNAESLNYEAYSDKYGYQSFEPQKYYKF